MSPESFSSNLLRESAAAWYARLHGSEADAAIHSEFARWMATASEHRLAYAEVSAAAFAAELALDAARIEAPAVHSTWAARTRRPVRIWLALAALLLLATLASLGPRQWDNLRADLVSAEGERRVVTVNDGSVVTLDADTAIRTHFSADRRDLELLRGRAYFVVAKDAARPFAVSGAGASARAVGTRFGAARTRDGLIVDVEEGLVDVANAAGLQRLGAGQATRASLGFAPIAAPADVSAALAWREGQLVFTATPLREALERLDAYIPGSVVLINSAAANRPVTAIVPAAQAEEGIDSIAHALGLRTRRIAGVLTAVY